MRPQHLIVDKIHTWRMVDVAHGAIGNYVHRLLWVLVDMPVRTVVNISMMTMVRRRLHEDDL